MVLCYADTMDLATVVIGTRCSFHPRLLTFTMIFLVCSFLMVSPCHGTSWTLLWFISRRRNKLKFLCFFTLIVCTLMYDFKPFDARCSHMSTAIKHPMPARVKPSFVILTSGHSDTHGWASKCPDVKNYKCRLNPIWHSMLNSCTHKPTVGINGLNK